MDAEKFIVGAGYRTSGFVVLTLRMSSLLEQQNLGARFADISDTLTADKKAEEKFQIVVDSLASFSSTEDFPVFRAKDGTERALVEGAETPAAAIKGYFSERTKAKERIAHKLLVGWERSVDPELVFQ